MEERKGFARWIEKNKEKLIIAGIGTGSLLLVVLGIRNRETIQMVWNSLKEAVKQPTEIMVAANITLQISPELIPETVTAVVSDSKCLPFEVSGHIRNLPDGWRASPEKIAEAMENNIMLLDGQTWVDSYVKGGIAD